MWKATRKAKTIIHKSLAILIGVKKKRTIDEEENVPPINTPVNELAYEEKREVLK